MFGLFKKQTAGEKVVFKIDGMHCTSCSMNIDGELEDTKGVISATTSYAKATCKIQFDPAKVTRAKLQKVIEELGYGVREH